MQYEIRDLHLELSSLCNARCPFCPRNLNGYPHNFGYRETNLSLEDVSRIFPTDIIKGVEHILINGNFGDFVMNPESADIIEYFLAHNPKVKVEVSTNGSARDRAFWERLGSMGIEVVFAIDGLEDTHHLYRQDTSFANIIKNAQHFIKAGGLAHWKMIKFDHNIKDRAAVYQMAKDLGFAKITMLDSVRDNGPVYDRKGKKIHFIKKDNPHFPDHITAEWINLSEISYDRMPHSNTGRRDISCWAEKNSSVYVAADGHVYPCCWVGFNPLTYRPLSQTRTWNKELSAIIEHNHGPTVGISKAMEWFDKLEQAWHAGPQPSACKFFCGSKLQ